jgi:hypothetical protein
MQLKSSISAMAAEKMSGYDSSAALWPERWGEL